MRSAFLGLDMALRALQASQQALETTSHNIANANTPGYSRQEVQLTASRPYTVPTIGGYPFAGQVGTGVLVTAMKRYRDAFVDLQIRQERRMLGVWSTIKDSLEQVELVLPEPSDSGLNALLNRFWNAWEDLANEPQSQAVRASVRQQAANLCSALNHSYQQLLDLQHDQDTQISIKVQEINSIAEQLAALNSEIQKVEVTGNRPNDLRDQRDLLLDRLATVVNITYREGDNGLMSVFIGGAALVYDLKANALKTEAGANGLVEIQWAADGSSVDVIGGELKGTLTARDSILANKLAELDAIAAALIAEVNNVHATGYGLNNNTGLAFFTGTGARNIALSSDILNDLNNIAAASAPDAPGDGRQATAIAEIRRLTLAALGDRSIGDYYAAMITELGTYTKGIRDTSANQEVLVQHLERQRESLSGVSLDEEAANLVKYERAYQAAARVMTTVDEMLDHLINGTGRVGL